MNGAFVVCEAKNGFVGDIDGGLDVVCCVKNGFWAV